MKKSTLIPLIFFCFFNSLTFAQKDSDTEIDKTAFLLGMLDYPRVKFYDNPQYENVIVGYKCKNKFLKNLFYTTIQKLDTIDSNSLVIKQEEEYFLIESKECLDYLDSYQIFVPYTRRSILKEELRNEKIDEGYINPYRLSLKQQESFVLGLIISKADFNKKPMNITYVNGKYKMEFSHSKMYFTLAYLFMENSGFHITSHGTSGGGVSELTQYESFGAHIEFDAPPHFDDYIFKMISTRNKIREENCK